MIILSSNTGMTIITGVSHSASYAAEHAVRAGHWILVLERRGELGTSDILNILGTSEMLNEIMSRDYY